MIKGHPRNNRIAMQLRAGMRRTSSALVAQAWSWVGSGPVLCGSAGARAVHAVAGGAVMGWQERQGRFSTAELTVAGFVVADSLPREERRASCVSVRTSARPCLTVAVALR